ncbi:MAG: trimethylamine methyltransferase family protein [Candidatus Bathyarchaeia archaeon]
MTRRNVQFFVLSNDDIYRIHLASMNLLEEVGVKFESEKALQVLSEAGANVDFKSKTAKIPEYMVREALKKAPSRCILYGRDYKYRLILEHERVYFAMLGWVVYVLDLESGKRREGTLSDIDLFFKLGDYLENIHFLNWAVWPKGVPGDLVHIYGLFSGFKNTTKPLEGYIRGEIQAQDNIKMASIVAGSEEELKKRPLLMAIENPVSPLQHSKEMIEGLMEYAKFNQPIAIAPECQAGASAPATLGGLLVQQNCEVLSGIVLAESVNPGTPVLYGTVSTITDMKTGNIALGAVELGLINAATAQIAHYYRLPTRGTGGTTDSKVPDIQAGLEKAVTLMMAVLAGINFIYSFAGTLESTMTMSYEQLVIDNELAGMATRAIKGIEIDDYTLAVDIIKKVGPGGHYLTQKHTLESFRKEHYIPTILNRLKREAWERAGSKDLVEIAREKVKQILKEHEPEPLDKSIEDALKRFITEKRKHGKQTF